MNDKALATRETGAVDVVAQLEPPSVGMMLQGVIEKGVTADNVAAIEKLVGLYERMEAKKAEVEFAGALVKLQAAVKNVTAIRPCTIGGSVRYYFAPYEDLMIEVAPHLEANGFAVSYGTKVENERMTKTLILSHVSGHQRTNDYSVKISKPIQNREGKDTVSESQMESMAGTTAKRGALCDALNIVVEKYEQEDARIEGGPVTREQAEELERRAKMVNADIAKFMAYAGAATFAEIASSKYEILSNFLTRKEQGK